jgi:RNA polymerase sigma factor (sigma-70 family)
MHAPALPPILGQIRRAARAASDVPDADLLNRFTRDRDEAAFADLVRRHGPLILGVCRRVLSHHDAEDAYQTTFLILARKAGKLTGRASVAGWLCRVACNVARKARRAAARRAVREARAVTPPRSAPGVGLADVCAALDAEVARLPDAEREAFTVCVLDGLSKTRAARRLGWTEGTVSGRLARARERLRTRLARRGITLSAVLTAINLVGPTDALTPALVAAVVRRASEQVARGALVGSTRMAGALMLVGLTLTAGIASWLGQPPEEAGQPKTPGIGIPAKEPAAGPRLDIVGDPLPDRVVARIGHQRFRHEGMVWAVAVSPDGKTIASVTWDGGIVRIWEAETGKVLRSWVTGASDRPTDLRFLGQGEQLFVGMTGTTLPPHIAEVATGKVVWKADPNVSPEGKGRGANGTALSADGKVLVEFWHDGTVRVSERATGNVRFEKKLIDVGASILRTVRVLPDGKSFLLLSPSGTEVLECSAETGVIVHKYATGVRSPDLCVSTDGRYFAVAEPGGVRDPSAKDTIIVWDRRTNEPVRTIARRFPEVFRMEFNPDGKTLAVGSTGPGAEIVLMNTADGSEVRRFPWSRLCLCLAFTSDGRTLVSGDIQGLLARWDVATGEPLPVVKKVIPNDLHLAEFVAGGKELLTYGQQIAAWDPATGKPLRTLHGSFSPFSDCPYFSTGVSPDGRSLALYRHDEKAERKDAIWVRDLATGRERVLFDKLIGPAAATHYSADGTRLVVAGYDQVVRVLDVATGRLLHELKNHEKPVDHALFSPDGRRIVSYGADANADGDHDIRVWDAESGKLLHRLPPVRGSAFQAVFTPDGKQLVSVGGDPGRSNTKGEIHVWDVASGKLLRVWEGHKERVTCVAVSPDGRSILTGSLDRGLRLWDLTTGRLRHEFTAHRAYVTSVNFAPDGLRFVACSTDAPGYVWDLYGHLTGKPSPWSAADAKTVWAELADADPAIGFRAECRLTAAGDSTVSHLRDLLKPVPATDAAKVERWLADLGADRFAVREQAAVELARVADQVRPQLQKALASASVAEVRERLTKLLETAEADSSEYRQARRVCEALEAIGTPAACRFAVELAGGAAGARLTDEARGTVERLSRRP